MKRTTPIYFVSLLFLASALNGCWWKEIERENLELRTQIDSLNALYSSCVVENSRVTVRIEDMQRQNAKLEQRNIEIANRMIEIGKLPPPPRVEPAEFPPLAEGVTYSQRTGTDPQTVLQKKDSLSTPSTGQLKNTDNEPEPEEAPPVQTAKPRKAEPIAHPPIAAPPPPTSTARAGDRFLKQYQAALAEFNLRHFSVALEGFTSLLSSFESNDMSDNCEYWIGECEYALGNYQAAIERFTNVLRYTQSDKTDDALMMRGNTYMRLREYTNARDDFQRIVDDFPESEFALRAKQKLKSLR